MDINVLVTGGVGNSAAGESATRFCDAAVAAGHKITQVFFYESGVSQLNHLIEPLSDEFNSVTAWQNVARKTGCPLVVCVSAGERRGVIGREQAAENQLDSITLGDDVEVAGLASFWAACLASDRTVTFR